MQALHIVITLGNTLFWEVGSSITLVELLPEMKASATTYIGKQSRAWDTLDNEMEVLDTLPPSKPKPEDIVVGVVPRKRVSLSNVPNFPAY